MKSIIGSTALVLACGLFGCPSSHAWTPETYEEGCPAQVLVTCECIDRRPDNTYPRGYYRLGTGFSVAGKRTCTKIMTFLGPDKTCRRCYAPSDREVYETAKRKFSKNCEDVCSAMRAAGNKRGVVFFRVHR